MCIIYAGYFGIIQNLNIYPEPLELVPGVKVSQGGTDSDPRFLKTAVRKPLHPHSPVDFGSPGE
ncbi:MAG: hypothetical protein EP310_08895 [Bacteroidetes bacterium]|nr:MAG: hypothetical protein EP310_08895 [Bacteroidota bacterium]